MTNSFRRFLDGTASLRAPDGETGAGEANAAAADVTPASTPAPDAGNPAEGEGSSPTLAEGETPAAAAATPGDGTPEIPTPASGAQKRIDALTGEKWAERRAKEAAENKANLLQQQLDSLRANPPAPALDADGNPVQPQAAPVKPVNPAELQRMAENIAAQTQFQKDVAGQIEAGRGVHADFDQVAQNLQRFGELPRHFVEAAIATGRGSDIIYELGKNVAEADRILTLPPIQQAVAMATLAASLPKVIPPKLVSSAPAPITPKISGKTTNTPSLSDPDIPIADFIKMRDKQIADSKKGNASARR